MHAAHIWEVPGAESAGCPQHLARAGRAKQEAQRSLTLGFLESCFVVKTLMAASVRHLEVRSAVEDVEPLITHAAQKHLAQHRRLRRSPERYGALAAPSAETELECKR